VSREGREGGEGGEGEAFQRELSGGELAALLLIRAGSETGAPREQALSFFVGASLEL
jgi:hypothetical protein